MPVSSLQSYIQSAPRPPAKTSSLRLFGVAIMALHVSSVPFTDSRSLHISRCTNAHNISLRVSLSDK